MNIALILAGGSGIRMGQETPKQFLNLCDKPVILHSLISFQSHNMIDKIYIVCHQDWTQKLGSILKDKNITKLQSIVGGGNSRKQSCYNGLLEISKTASEDDIVLIHDAARPNISHSVINNNIAKAKSFGAAATVIPITDTVFNSENEINIDCTLNRQKLFLAQTPQSFKLKTILDAHSSLKNDDSFTDDVGLLLKLNIPVCMVIGDKTNLKLTTNDDFEIMKLYMLNKSAEH